MQPQIAQEPRTMPGSGLVVIRSNEQIDQEQRDEQRRQTDAAQGSILVTSLSSHVTKCWHANKSSKEINIEQELLRCLRQISGKYGPDELREIEEQKEPPIYMMVTNIKCRAAKAWLTDIMTPTGETPFHFKPTPIPELPPEYYDQAKQNIAANLMKMLEEQGITKEQITREMMQEVSKQVKEEIIQQAEEQANADADDLTKEVNDELVEGGWYKALEDVISDIVDYPACFLHGPIVRRKPKLVWEQGEGGKSVPVVKTVIVREWEAVSPFDMYPSANAKTVQDGNLIHRIRFSRQDLVDMIDVPGFDSDAIRAVLAVHGAGGLRNWTTVDSERAELESHDNYQNDPEATIECLKFMGNIRGQLLRDWGMSDREVPDMDIDYPAIVYQIGSFVISARINPHPLGRRKYYSTSFDKKRNSIWGNGVPQLMRDNARMCNSAARAIARNMGIASGPQVWSIVDRLPEGMAVTDMRPWKHWQFTSKNSNGKGDLPMGFFSPNVIVEYLLAIYKFFYDQASEVTGVPQYVHGSEKVAGAGRTARGLTMLMNAAARGLKMVARHMDRSVITESVEEHKLHMIMTEPDRVTIGDISVIARASEYLLQQENLQIQQEEFLNNTNNGIDLEIMGYEGRGEILRELAKSLKIPVDKIIPDRDSLLQKTAEKKLMGMLENVANTLGIPVQALLQIAQGGGGGQRMLPQ